MCDCAKQLSCFAGCNAGELETQNPTPYIMGDPPYDGAFRGLALSVSSISWANWAFVHYSGSSSGLLVELALLRRQHKLLPSRGDI